MIHVEIIAVIVVLIVAAMDPLKLQDSGGARALSCGPDGGVANPAISVTFFVFRLSPFQRAS